MHLRNHLGIAWFCYQASESRPVLFLAALFALSRKSGAVDAYIRVSCVGVCKRIGPYDSQYNHFGSIWSQS